jgi:hypothetical protein
MCVVCEELLHVSSAEKYQINTQTQEQHQQQQLKNNISATKREMKDILHSCKRRDY